MSKSVRVECPLTGKRFTVEPESWALPVLDELEDDAPLGWGLLTVTVAVTNPERQQVEDQRKALLDSLLTNPDIPLDYATRAVDKDLPLPSAFLRATWTVPDLSPEAMVLIRSALAEAGLVLELPDAE